MSAMISRSSHPDPMPSSASRSYGDSHVQGDRPVERLGGASHPHPTKLKDLAEKVVNDARALASAEAELLKSEVFRILWRSRLAIVLLLVAPSLALATLSTTMVGLLIVIMPLINPWFSLLLILGGGLSIATTCAWVALRSLLRLTHQPLKQTLAGRTGS